MKINLVFHGNPYRNLDMVKSSNKSLSDKNKKIDKWIDLEITSYCNSCCAMCLRQIARPNGLMKPEVFIKLVNGVVRCPLYQWFFYNEKCSQKSMFKLCQRVSTRGLAMI